MSGTGGNGRLEVAFAAATPAVGLLSIRDAGGRVRMSQRLHHRHTAFTLPAGDYEIRVDDDRRSTDPARLRGEARRVRVLAGGLTRVTATLAHAAALTCTVRDGDRPARFARVHARHEDGAALDLRADGHGSLTVGGLQPGAWRVWATDSGRRRIGPTAQVTVGAEGHEQVRLLLDTDTARLAVRLIGGRGPESVDVVDARGGRHTAAVVRGTADVSGLPPGDVVVEVPGSPGHAPRSVPVTDIPAGSAVVTSVALPPSVTLTGRVIQRGPVRSGLVRLLDADGDVLETTRTDEHGRFALGVGLRYREGLTVEATSGPENLHVTRVAAADIVVGAHGTVDLGFLCLPLGGRPARWGTRTNARASAAMKLPSTRV